MPLPFSFQQLFERSPNAYMVLDRELRFLAANAAYLEITSTRLEELLGRQLFEIFPHDPADPGNDNARQLRESFLRVLATGEPDTLALIAYRVPDRRGPAGPLQEDRFWSATHTPLTDETGQVAYILQHTVDITDLERLRRAGRLQQAPTVAQLEAGVLGRAGQVQEANRRLERDRLELLQMFEQAPGFVCFLRGKHHVFELANAAYLRLVGRPLALGRPVAEALPDLAGQGYFELLDRVFETGEAFVARAAPVALQEAPGGPSRQVFLDFIYQPIRGADGAVTGILVQGQDITDQRLADQARTAALESLRRSEERSRALVAALAEGVMVRDPSGRVLDVNDSAARLLGVEREALIGSRGTFPDWKVFQEDGTPQTPGELVSSVAQRTGTPQVGKVVGVRRGDGSLAWFTVNAQPLFDREGEPPSAVVTSFSDITERKLREEFEQQLIGIVSHDLRNPVTAMMLSASALLKKEKPDAGHLQRGLARIVKSGERATRLIRELLDFTQARLGSGIPVNCRPTRLDEIARLTVDEVQQAYPERELRLSVEGDTSGCWDPDRVAQILTNLAANAVAYSPDGSPVEVEVWGGEEEAVLAVHNQGEPIPTELLPLLFEPFRRGAELRLRAAGNIGLGLFIVDQLVRAHHGTIQVHSTQEEGTSFTVVLPRARAVPSGVVAEAG